MLTVERRTLPVEVEVRAKGDDLIFAGYAAKFRKLSHNLGGFVEECIEGCFADSIAKKADSQLNDIRALKNHDAHVVIGRQANGTLRVSEDDTGLYWEGRGNGKKASIVELAEDVRRGDINQGSFGFRAIEDRWTFTEQDFPLRQLLAVELFDVSVVTYPAYLDTSAGMRSIALRSFLASHQVDDPEALRALDAAGKRSIAEVLDEWRAGDAMTCTAGDRSIITPADDGTITVATENGPAVFRFADIAESRLDAGGDSDGNDTRDDEPESEGTGDTIPDPAELQTRLAAMATEWAQPAGV